MKLRVCGMDVLSQEDIITYESILQEATQEYRDIVDSKKWKPATIKEKYQEQHSLQRHTWCPLNSQSKRL